jgi:hypothetical protein
MRFWMKTMLCCLLITAARGQSPYDGIWNVTIRTTTGSCELTATVADGKIPALRMSQAP